MMENEKGSFVVYTDIKETLDELTDEQVAALFRGMVNYQITGEDPEFKGSLKFVFIPIRQQMDRNNGKWERTKEARAEAGRRGGINSGKSRREANEANEANASLASSNEANEANEAVTVTVTGTVTGNVNGTVTDTVTVPDNMSDASSLASLVSSLLLYLNEKTGSNFKANESTTELIQTLSSKGYTESDFKSVIDKKTAEWIDSPKMRQYLRPRTLFGPKFEEYLSAPDPVEAEAEKKKAKEQKKLQTEKTQTSDSLKEILVRMDAIQSDPQGVKAHWDEWRELDEQKELAEEKIRQIDRRLTG